MRMFDKSQDMPKSTGTICLKVDPNGENYAWRRTEHGRNMPCRPAVSFAASCEVFSAGRGPSHTGADPG